MEDAAANRKRHRRDAEESPEEAKRLRADIFLEILDDDNDSGDNGDPAAQDIASFMKSFEEEIGLPWPRPPPEDAGQADLVYLLEASDDELGLPPTPVTSASDDAGEVVVLDGEPEGVGLGQIWGFDDDASGLYGGGMGFGIPPEDVGVFGYPDELYGPSDFYDISWRQETLPAI